MRSHAGARSSDAARHAALGYIAYTLCSSAKIHKNFSLLEGGQKPKARPSCLPSMEDDSAQEEEEQKHEAEEEEERVMYAHPQPAEGVKAEEHDCEESIESCSGNHYNGRSNKTVDVCSKLLHNFEQIESMKLEKFRDMMPSGCHDKELNLENHQSMKRMPLLELEMLIPNKRRQSIATNVDLFGLKERSVTEVYSSSLPASSQPFCYPCSVCARIFHSPKALHGHMRSHPGRPSRVSVLPPKSTPQQKPPAYSDSQKLNRQFQSISTAIDHGHDDGKFSAERSKDPRRVLMEPSRAASTHSDSRKAGFGAGFVLDRIRKPSSPLEITASILTSALSCSSVDEEEPLQERDNFAAVCLVMLAAGKIGTADLGPNCSSNMDLFCRGRFNGTTNCVVAHEKRDIKRDQAPQFQCRTCHKFFKSPQSLGGHRASHGTLSTASCYMARERAELLESVDRNELPGDEKGHKCSICAPS